MSYDNTIRDVQEAWGTNTLPDNMRQIFSSEEVDYDAEFMGVQRWGAIHDQYFFRN